MAHAGQELIAQNGFRLRLVETGGELLAMEGTYAGSGDFPPVHLHPSQTEHFEVLEGEIRGRCGPRCARPSSSSGSTAAR